ncbi:mao-A, putative [Talaromyces stipitatus ATCC 10500]|uniref:Amine oxidase n=1 Tax=Talaromyces stipitatus (strain ATCC 10500 / CBS 375.48 / QM 6759 / NRRL 1006) TaxID=441959 RepID=B8M1G5_TALSN|nr:mao-A, putative [Talaromyces stipitatus ATCC 10500]EED21861.1 mao-A, putative [Talaromyces stipitatus ATCC 10500]
MTNMTMTTNPSFVDSTLQPEVPFYSHAVSCNGAGRLIFTSGHIAQRKDGSWPETFEEQAKQAMDNLAGALVAAGALPKDIIKIIWYAVDWDSSTMGHGLIEPYLQYFTTEYGVTYRPITTLVPVPKLATPEAKFEIEAVAYVSGLSQPWSSGAGMKVWPTPPVEVDAVVVGGGFSGMMAGYEASQAGLKVAVLEARHRIGGRSWTQALESGHGHVELGATWINKTTQPLIYSLTQKFKLKTIEQYVTGDEVFQTSNGKVYRKAFLEALTEDPKLSTQFERFIVILKEAIAERNIRKWDDIKAEEDVAFDEWARLKGVEPSSELDDFCSFLTRTVVGREAHEVGAHYFLDYLQSGFGFESIISEGEIGAQSLKVKPGTSAIAEALAKSMPHGSVFVNTPVSKISQYQGGSHPCLVTTKDGQQFRAKKVILAVPTNTYDLIDFSPPLPREKRVLVSNTRAGVYAKVILTYLKPWWRTAGLVGKFQSHTGPISMSWDISDEDQSSLALFVCGDGATKWHALSKLGRQEAIIEHLIELVGPELADKARSVLEYKCVEWTKEEFIGGAPTSVMGPGMLSKYGQAFRQPFQNIHIAGGEAAFEWKGYLEGALSSGQRAATEVVDILGTTAQPSATESRL